MNKRIKAIKTKELLEIIKLANGYIVEASIRSGFFNVTHFLYMKNNHLYDQNCDGESRCVSKILFTEWYGQTYWIINQNLSTNTVQK